MKCPFAALVVILAILNVANAQWAYEVLPTDEMGRQTGMIGGPHGLSPEIPYGAGFRGVGWGRRRMMGGMMNPYMGMMYGR